MERAGDTQFFSLDDIEKELNKADAGKTVSAKQEQKKRAKRQDIRSKRNKDGKINVCLLFGVPVLVFILAIVATVWSITGGRPFDKVAATIGTEYRLYEDDVTDYIQSNRKRLGITDDDGWRKWLEKSNLSVDDVRTQTINYFVRMHVLEKECKRLGIEVTYEDIDKDIQNTKGAYGYTDDEWEEQLSSRGYDDESYRIDVHDRLLSNALLEKVTAISDGGLESDAVLNVIKNNADTFKSATKVSCIVLRDDETDKADEISKKLASDPSKFDKLKEENSESSLYDGWTIASEISSVLTDKVKDNKVDDITGQIALEDNGIIIIAKITDKVSVDGDITAVNQLSDDLIETITENMASSGRNEKLSRYLDDLVSKTNVHTNDIDVTQLLYYVEMTKKDDASSDSADNQAGGNANNVNSNGNKRNTDN